jgi:hypothetical protein
MIQFIKNLLTHECEYELSRVFPEPIPDWRVSQNLHHEIWLCKYCDHKQWRSGYYDKNLKPQERIPPLKGECELSLR